MIKNLKKMMGKGTPEKELTPRDHEIIAFSKISENWNLENIQEYIRGNNPTYPLSDVGMSSILLRFINQRKDDAKFESGKRREFEVSDRIERTKKGLDIVILISNKNILSSDTIPLIKEFIELYPDVIQNLDRKLSQTYEYKMKSAYKNAEVNALTKSQFKRELGIKYDK